MNALIERVHQVLGNFFRTFELENRELDEDNLFKEFLTAAAYAIFSSHHRTLDATPEQLVFGRDMVLPIQFKELSIKDSNYRREVHRHQHQRGSLSLLSLER